MDIIVDRIQAAYLEKTDGTPIGVLTQLSEATIEITGESTDAVDATGTLIKRFWRSKAGTFTATNAMINLNVAAIKSGSDKEVAAAGSPIKNVPGVKIVKLDGEAKLAGIVTGSTPKVNWLYNNGTLGAAVTAGEGGYTLSGEDFTAPTAAPTGETGINRVIVRYDRDATSGVAVHNKADKFPKTMRIILKVLVVDPCDASQLRSAIVDIPSF